MRKFLIAVFAACMVAAWVVPSMALDTVFDGQFRVRAIYLDNATDRNSSTGDESTWVDQRYRLGVKIAEGAVSTYLQLQIGDGATDPGAGNSKVWGAGGGATNGTRTGVGYADIQVRQAWIEFPTGPVKIKLGRTYVSSGFLAGGLFDNIVDRYAFTYKLDDSTTISFIHAKPFEGRVTGTAAAGNSNDRNVYNLGALHKMGDMGSVAGRVYYVTDSATGFTTTGAATAVGSGNFDATWLTAYGDLKFDTINVYISGAYLMGNAKDTTGGTANAYDISGYAFHGDVNATFGQAKVGFVAGLGSGDSSTTDKKLNTFFAPGPASYVHTAIFLQNSQPQNNDGVALPNNGQRNMQNGSNQSLGNLTWAGLYGDFKANDDLTLSAKAAMFQQTEALSTTGTPTKSNDIGQELDLVGNYKLGKGLALVGTAAWFMPGNGFTGKDVNSTAKSDTISLYFARLQWDF